jgi:hypothetical protein
MILDDLLKNYDETERPDFKQGGSCGQQKSVIVLSLSKPKTKFTLDQILNIIKKSNSDSNPNTNRAQLVHIIVQSLILISFRAGKYIKLEQELVHNMETRICNHFLIPNLILPVNQAIGQFIIHRLT